MDSDLVRMVDEDFAAEPKAEVGQIFVVPVSSLTAANSPRLGGEDAQHVRILSESAALPPILVQRHTMRVIDGMHRLQVARLKNQDTIEVRFFDGNDDEAFLAAVRANISHGLPLTLADREAAAERIVHSYPERSDRWVAAAVGLAPGTVKAIRRRARRSDQSVSARIGRDGRIRPLNGANGRLLASEEIARNPSASLREIARAAGISPATVRDVRERMRRGVSVVPNASGDKAPPKQSIDSAAKPSARQQPSPAAAQERIMMLRALHKDPSLRFTDSGRALLRWLDDSVSGPGSWECLFKDVSPHCIYTVVRLARLCADEWLLLATNLESRLKKMELMRWDSWSRSMRQSSGTTKTVRRRTVSPKGSPG